MAEETVSRLTGVPVAYLDPSPPSEIVDGRVYLSGQFSAADAETLRLFGFTHIVNCARECDDYFADRGVVYLRLNLVDSDRQRIDFEAPTRFISEALAADEKNKVLVHCLSGISRSAVVAAAFLVRSEGLSAADALAKVKQRRPAAKPLSSFKIQLHEWASS